MSSFNSTDNSAAEAPQPKPAADIDQLCQFDIVADRLNQAHATLDLIYTLTTNNNCSEEHIETLCEGTLSDAIHSAMLRIEEALEAARVAS